MVGTLDSYLNDIRQVTPCTKNGKCIGCGECCGNILPMSKAEIKTIKRYIRLNGIKEQKTNFPLANIVIDMTCPFLDVNKKCDRCTIYEVRPQICRSFICDRKDFDMKLLDDYREAVDVRKEFFGR